MISTPLIGLAAFMLTAGCSAALVPQQGKIASGQAMTCKVTTTTGSNLPRRVCKTQAEREQERMESQRTLEQDVFRPSVPVIRDPANGVL
jgi:hypothetical protein